MDEARDVRIPAQYRWTVKQRLAVLAYADLYGIKPAAARFGLDRKTVRTWRNRRRAGGAAALVPRDPARRARRGSAELVALGAQARHERQYGATRTPVWLFRLHHLRGSQRTIPRICRDIGLPRLRRTKKRAPKQLTRFEKPRPGDSVQVDVTGVKVGGEKA